MINKKPDVKYENNLYKIKKKIRKKKKEIKLKSQIAQVYKRIGKEFEPKCI